MLRYCRYGTQENIESMETLLLHVSIDGSCHVCKSLTEYGLAIIFSNTGILDFLQTVLFQYYFLSNHSFVASITSWHFI